MPKLEDIRRAYARVTPQGDYIVPIIMPSIIQYRYAFEFKPGKQEIEKIIDIGMFRATKIYSSVGGCAGFISGIYFGSCVINMVVGDMLRLDDVGLPEIQAMQEEFLKSHGIFGKSEREIQKYLDENDLRMPDVPHLDFPTVLKGDKIRIEGEFYKEGFIHLVGYTRG